MSTQNPIRKKDMEWMLKIMGACTGTYPGMRLDFIPESVVHRLERAGLIELFVPHNPQHKDRVTLTDAGRIAASKARAA